MSKEVTVEELAGKVDDVVAAIDAGETAAVERDHCTHDLELARAARAMRFDVIGVPA